MHDFLVGGVIGLVQAGVGHPFDTVKTLLQNGQSFRKLRPVQYYRGVAYPTAASLVFNLTTFPVFGFLVGGATVPQVVLVGAISGTFWAMPFMLPFVSR